MVAKFNETFTPAGADAASSAGAGAGADVECTGHAITGDLLTDPPSASLDKPELHDFDIAAIGLGFHHMADPKRAIERLVLRVRPGTGVVLIIDWLPDADADAGNGHSHHHQDHGHGHGQREAKSDANENDASQDGPEKTIKTHGFSEEDMKGLFESAGCTDFGFSLMEEPAVLWMGEGEDAKRREKRIFLARGTRRG